MVRFSIASDLPLVYQWLQRKKLQYMHQVRVFVIQIYLLNSNVDCSRGQKLISRKEMSRRPGKNLKKNASLQADDRKRVEM